MSQAIVEIIRDSSEPLETMEVYDKFKESAGEISRSKLLYRLNDLRGDGEIQGKSVGSGKGVWIWWKGQKQSR